MANRKGAVGYLHHKAGCICRACKSRRRQAETISGAAGESNPEMEIPIIYKRRKEPVDSILPVLYAGGSKTDDRGSRVRERVATWIRMRALEPTITKAEVAKRLGVHPGTISHDIQLATKEGWLRFEDSLDKLEYQVLPKVVDNLDEFIDKKDKTVTLEIAKGTLFKVYQAAHGASDAPVTMLALKIENTPPEAGKIFSGVVVGKPNLEE